MTMTNEQSFTAGWNYGALHMVELTAREISAMFPNANTDTFAQGNIDGMNGDTFRCDPLWFFAD